MDREQDAQLELDKTGRVSDVIYVETAVGERDLSNRGRGGEQDEEMEEGEDLKGVQPTQQEDER